MKRNNAKKNNAKNHDDMQLRRGRSAMKDMKKKPVDVKEEEMADSSPERSNTPPRHRQANTPTSPTGRRTLAKNQGKKREDKTPRREERVLCLHKVCKEKNCHSSKATFHQHAFDHMPTADRDLMAAFKCNGCKMLFESASCAFAHEQIEGHTVLPHRRTFTEADLAARKMAFDRFRKIKITGTEVVPSRSKAPGQSAPANANGATAPANPSARHVNTNAVQVHERGSLEAQIESGDDFESSLVVPLLQNMIRVKVRLEERYAGNSEVTRAANKWNSTMEGFARSLIAVNNLINGRPEESFEEQGGNNDGEHSQRSPQDSNTVQKQRADFLDKGTFIGQKENSKDRQGNGHQKNRRNGNAETRDRRSGTSRNRSRSRSPHYPPPQGNSKNAIDLNRGTF